ncbi:cobyrinate a,c-diamide synthase [Desulfovibrio cuneatus]|uniref:cobyrinate a,c-diamide synthase n=1 Tax=Desulfovibrio cuneatus TaxID=159728 RepID=UPI000406AA9C|nr:cobyrinate a,c-diamide synthase [Desulfovibrio cuneatus]
MSFPRLVIAGLSGGSGKTLVSLGVTRALCQTGHRVKTFKKGPDYIDSAWLASAAGTAQGNLDPYFCPPEQLVALFMAGAQGHDISLIEGNRGLFDGVDTAGTASTSALARSLGAPVVLVMDCTKMTRTAAAIVLGCTMLEPELHLAGVILNRTGTERQRTLITQAVETLTGVPVLGALPRHTLFHIEERHMGLAYMEEEAAAVRLDALAELLATHVNMPQLLEIARNAPALCPAWEPKEAAQSGAEPQQTITVASKAFSVMQPRIGYVHDSALWFYYQENFDALKAAGAQLVPLSILDETPWPSLDGLYLGGGVPEQYAAQLAQAKSIRAHVYTLASQGMPIYAECGGFMYLCSTLHTQEGAFPMAGVFPGSVTMSPRPNGLGYVEATVSGYTPFFPAGLSFKGHEFHFSSYTPAAQEAPAHIVTLHKGKGMTGGHPAGADGLCRWQTHAGYTHIYAPAVPCWAPNFVHMAHTWGTQQRKGR